MKSISVVLNAYKRSNLKEQVEAIKNQTVEVDEIFYWQNTAPGVEYDEDTYNDLNAGSLVITTMGCGQDLLMP